MRHEHLAIKELHKYEVMIGKNKEKSWDNIYTLIPQQIMSICDKRMQHINKKFNKEKDGDVLGPYNFVKEIVGLVKELNEDFQRKTTMLGKYMMLRVLVIFLLTLYGCIRGETVLNADLSDLNYLFFDSTRERSPFHVMMFLMGEGKTKKILSQHLLVSYDILI